MNTIKRSTQRQAHSTLTLKGQRPLHGCRGSGLALHACLDGTLCRYTWAKLITVATPPAKLHKHMNFSRGAVADGRLQAQGLIHVIQNVVFTLRSFSMPVI